MLLSEEQRLTLRRDGESSHDHYKRIERIRTAAVIEKSKKRCINCEQFSGQHCKHYDQKVEDEYIFAANDCPSFSNDDIPF